jgi:Flp pilus assembly protein TadG
VTKSKGVSTLRQFRRTGRDEGAAAVEFSLIFVFVFIPATFGLLASGTAFSRQINVTQAVREASRYGATYDIGASGVGGTGGTLSTWLPKVDDALCMAVNNGNACDPAGGPRVQSANPLAGYDYRCVAFVTTTDTATPTVVPGKSSYREVDGVGGPVTGQGACPSTTPAAIRNATYVQVVLSRDVDFNLVVANPTLHLDAVSVTPYEGTTKP